MHIRLHRLMAQDGGTGGGAGGTGGQGAGGTAGEFTPDQIDRIQGLVAKGLADGLTARLKTFEKQLETKIGDTIAGSIGKALEGIKKVPAGDDPDEGGSKGKKSNLELDSMKKQLEELRLTNEANARKAAEERRKNRDAARTARVSEALGKNGVNDSTKVRHALAVLNQDGRVQYEDDDSDRLVWKDDDGTVIDFEQGFRKWIKTPDAAHFLPAAGGRNPGGRGSNLGAPLTGADAAANRNDFFASLGETLRNGG